MNRHIRKKANTTRYDDLNFASTGNLPPASTSSVGHTFVVNFDAILSGRRKTRKARNRNSGGIPLLSKIINREGEESAMKQNDYTPF